MDLSSELISQFVKATKDETKQTSEATIYGTTVEYNGTMYVKLDGSERLTPVETTVALKSNERVTVLVKNHTATVTGNISSPAARNTDVEALTATVANFDTVIAEQIDAKTANIESAIITNLDGKYATFDAIEAAEADIDILKADNVTINQKLTARDAEIDQLKADSLTVQVADAKYATIDNLTGTNAKLNNLESTYGEFKVATVDRLDAVEADIANLDVGKLDVKYANIDFSNIGQAAMENFYANSGLIKNVVVGDQTITGELVGVTISGDLIKANTLKAEQIVIRGSDGNFYKLNTDFSGLIGVTPVEEDLIHGSNIIAKSITADKIKTTDLVAIAAKIGNFNIGDNYIYSGVKASVDNTTRGIYMDTNGQLNVGDSNNYLKFYKDQNGTYKLAIAAESLTFGVSGTKIEDAFDEVKDSVNNIQVGGRNLLRFTGELPIGTTRENGVYSWNSAGVLTKTADGIKLNYSNHPDVCIGLALSSDGIVKSGDTLTLSFDYRGNITNFGHAYFIQKTSPNVILTGFPSLVANETEWQHYEYTFTATNANVRVCYSFLMLYGASSSATDWVEIKKGSLKLEKGNKATDWTPAPEDVASDISSAQTVADNAQSTANNAVNAVNNLQVGGRNLFRQSGQWTNLPTWWISNGGGITLDTTNKYLGHNTLSTTVGDGIVGANYGFIELDVNKTYTYSALIKSDASYGGEAITPLHYHCSTDGVNNNSTVTAVAYDQAIPVANTWKLLYLTFRPNGKYFRPFVYIGGGSRKFNIAYLKLEEGNKPTDWTPAPEDVNTAIDNIQVGGRNLFKNTGMQYDNPWGCSTYYRTPEKSGFAIQVTNNTGDLLPYLRFQQIGLDGVTGNYTFSANVYASADNVDVMIDICDAGNERFTIGTIKQKIAFTAYVVNFTEASGYNGFVDVGGTAPIGTNIYFEDVKIERGTRATDWSPAPEDINAGISSAQSTADTAVSDAATAINKVDNLQVGGRNLILKSGTPRYSTEYMVSYYLLSENWIPGQVYTLIIKGQHSGDYFGLYRDNGWVSFGGIVTSADTDYIESITFTCPESNPDNPDSRNNALTIYDMPYGASHNSSISWIKLVKGNVKLTDWTPAPEDRIGQINYSQGKMLFKDPMFETSTNGCIVYNNAGNGTVTISRTARSSDNPFTNSGYELTITNTGWAEPHCGGFFQQFMSRANARFICRIIAKIPTGRYISYHSNAYGDGGYALWHTSTVGTGKFEEYIVEIVCGSSGIFQTGGFFAINGDYGTSDAPVKWYVAYSTCYDMDNTSDISSAQSAADNAQSTANTANSTANTANNKTDALSRGSGNLWPDPSFLTTGIYEGWQVGNGTDPHYGNFRIFAGRDHYSYHAIPVTPGHKYKISCAAYRHWGSLELNMAFWIAIQSGSLEPYSLLGNIIKREGNLITGSWTRISNVVVIPEGVTFGYLYFQLEQWDSDTSVAVTDVHIEDVTEAYEAAKTATSHMNFDSTNGLVISEDASSTAGNVQIKSDGFRIRNGTTVNASFLGNTITLGQNSTSSYINLCGDKGQIKVTSKDKYGAGTVDALQIDSEDITIYGESSVSSLLRCQDVGNYATMGQAWLHLTSQTNTANNGTKYYTPSIRLGIHATVTNIASTTIYGTHNNFIEISPDLGTAMYSGTSMIRCRDSNYYGSSAEMFSYGMVKLAVYDSEINPYIEITPKTSDTTTTRIYMAARNINIDAIDMTTINSTATVNGNVVVPNGGVYYAKSTSGALWDMVRINEFNTSIFGSGSFYNNAATYLTGGDLILESATAGTNYRPYYRKGDSVSLTWSGAGFISSGGSKVYFSIPLSKPVIGNPAVTVSSVEGLTIRQNNAYLYGSSASVFAIASNYVPTLVGTDYVRVIATMPNTTNVTNNSSCGVYASIKITFS